MCLYFLSTNCLLPQFCFVVFFANKNDHLPAKAACDLQKGPSFVQYLGHRHDCNNFHFFLRMLFTPQKSDFVVAQREQR